MKRVAAILLAAGASSRMRGEDKLTRTIEGDALLRRSALTAEQSKADALYVVFGAHRAERESVLAGIRYQALLNEAWSEGMGGSIAAGIGAITKSSIRYDGALILLADMPDIDTALIDRLLSKFNAQGEAKTIIVPCAEGQRGNPVLFGEAHFPALAALNGPKGAAEIINNAAENVIFVNVSDEKIRRDLDTPEDWESYLSN